MFFNIGVLKKNISEFCIAIILTANILSQIIKSEGFFGILILGAFVLFLLLNPLKRNTALLDSNLVIRITAPIIIVLIAFLFTILYYGFNDEIKNLFLFFLLVGITSLFLAVYTINYIQVLKKITVVSIIFVFFFVRMDFSILDYGGETFDYTGYLMAISYGILPFLLSLISMWKISNSRLIKLLSIVFFLPYFIYLVVFGSRGAWIAFFMYIPLLFIIYQNKKINLFRLIGILLLLYAFFAGLFYLLMNNAFSQNIYDSYFVEKLMSIMQDGDFSSGRMDIYKYTWGEILRSPIWGYGIGAYDNFSGSYPHNFILQLLYEGGILLCLPILLILFKSIHIMSSNKYNIEQRIFITFLFMNSVIRLFLSYNLWMSQFFWLLIGLTIHISYNQKRENKI